jgi:hypothetical protein
LVQVDAVIAKTVETTAAARVIEGQVEIVTAEKPRESAPGLAKPETILCGRPSFNASRN